MYSEMLSVRKYLCFHLSFSLSLRGVLRSTLVFFLPRSGLFNTLALHSYAPANTCLLGAQVLHSHGTHMGRVGTEGHLPPSLVLSLLSVLNTAKTTPSSLPRSSGCCALRMPDRMLGQDSREMLKGHCVTPFPYHSGTLMAEAQARGQKPALADVEAAG